MADCSYAACFSLGGFWRRYVAIGLAVSFVVVE
jgi:hypothetical protein